MNRLYFLILLLSLALTACSDDPEAGNNTADNNTNNTNNTADTGQDVPGDDVGEADLTVQSVFPVQGSAAGGEEVSVSGTGFFDGATVYFGDTAAETVFVSSTQLDATTPAADVGTVDVSVETPGGERVTLENAFEFVDGDVLTVGSCVLQHPSSTSTDLDMPTEEIFGRVFVEDCTEGMARCDEVTAQLGWGAPDIDPSVDDDDWEWTSAEYNDAHTDGDQDEYRASMIPTDEGTLAYVYRVSVDQGRSWLYCDLDGNDGGSFDTDQMGTLSVDGPNTVSIDWCNVQHPDSTTTTAGTETETIYGQVYSDSCTDAGGHCPYIDAELGFGPSGADPSDDATAFTWVEGRNNAGFDGPNNDEYQATLTSDATGTFSYAWRFSGDGGTTWTYCDLDGTDNGFQADQQGTLTVDP